MNITEQLFAIAEKEYADFQAKLTPTISREYFIGIRVPTLRKIAKEYYKDEESKEFLSVLPHKYYEENMLHGFLIAEIKDYDECIKRLEEFLPFIDNWAICDTLSPKVFKKNTNKLINKIYEWSKSDKTYTIRYAIGQLMGLYLDDNYKKEYLELPSKIISDEYYVNMMIAWYYATALAKQYDDTIIYLQEKRLPKWVHNKTIQKAIESYRITDNQKEYLRTLKIK